MNKLSHSNNTVNLLGAHNDLNIDKTATGSVEDINTQNNKQTKYGIFNQTNGNIKNKTIEIINQEINNQKIAKADIVFQFANKCL
ncbi:MAG: hypothetical protein Q8S84_06920 [bacterium]|nr:hypothetical protein [bacterium]MDP3381190.1 hypothetical protein [bacterium]